MKNKRKWLIMGSIMVSLGLAELGRMVFERTDIWWTPMNHALSLDDARARVLIYVQGQELEERVERGELFLRTEAGTAAVSASDVALRFNNWDKIRASRLPIAALAAALTAVGLVLIVGCVMLVGRDRTESQKPS